MTEAGLLGRGERDLRPADADGSGPRRQAVVRRDGPAFDESEATEGISRAFSAAVSGPVTALRSRSRNRPKSHMPPRPGESRHDRPAADTVIMAPNDEHGPVSCRTHRHSSGDSCAELSSQYAPANSANTPSLSSRSSALLFIPTATRPSLISNGATGVLPSGGRQASKPHQLILHQVICARGDSVTASPSEHHMSDWPAHPEGCTARPSPLRTAGGPGARRGRRRPRPRRPRAIYRAHLPLSRHSGPRYINPAQRAPSSGRLPRTPGHAPRMPRRHAPHLGPARTP